MILPWGAPGGNAKPLFSRARHSGRRPLSIFFTRFDHLRRRRAVIEMRLRNRPGRQDAGVVDPAQEHGNAPGLADVQQLHRGMFDKV